jgi:hypothetical protein
MERFFYIAMTDGFSSKDVQIIIEAETDNGDIDVET